MSLLGRSNLILAYVACLSILTILIAIVCYGGWREVWTSSWPPAFSACQGSAHEICTAAGRSDMVWKNGRTTLVRTAVSSTIRDTTESQPGYLPPRMGRFKGEAGESPALSRNCKPRMRQARTTAQLRPQPASWKGGGSWQQSPLSLRQGRFD